VNPRFYAPGARNGAAITLPDEESQHLTRVLRLRAGAAIRVFDGRGQEFDAIVEKAGKSDAIVNVGAPRPPAAVEPRVAVTLAQAVLKGDKMDDVVRDAVMMGVAAIQPIVTARTEVALSTVQRGHRRERWQRIAVSSAKQCGRAVVPEIHEPIALQCHPGNLMFVEPSAFANVASLADVAARREVAVIVGPEGGWTPEEIARASEVCTLVTLRTPTLRADAMALVALASLFATWREL
jgi:16S rRNA (uracil1498-N3)-methyltransferase